MNSGIYFVRKTFFYIFALCKLMQLLTNGLFMKKLLIIDNYDSFTYNLYQQIQKMYCGFVEIKRNDSITVEEIKCNKYCGFVISPGPRTPDFAGVSKDIIRLFHRGYPILGICLGLQCINEVFGGKTVKSIYPVHGKTTEIKHNHNGLFKGLPNPLLVARYHSLKIDNIPSCLRITAYTVDTIPMAVEHYIYPTFGMQFHPESFLTEHGDNLIKNFLKYVQ